MNIPWTNTKRALIAEFVEATGSTEEEAKEYLQSEEWIYYEALYSWKVDHKD